MKAKDISYEEVDLTQSSAPEQTLQRALDSGIERKKLFNTSGMLYREKQLKEKLPSMSDQEAIQLLAQEGMLLKRPFLETDQGFLIGFKEEEWKRHFG